MPLVLRKTLSQCSREELETFIAAAQAKRLAAAVFYFETKTEKLGKVSDKQHERIQRQRDLLGKCLEKIGELLDAADLRMQTITQLEHESGMLDEQLEEIKEKRK